MKLGIFAGRVGQDAELKYTPSGLAVAKFSIACNRIGKDSEGENQKPLWVKATIWRDRAEKLAPHIKKGQVVIVSGEVDLRTWTGKDGEAHTDLEVTVDKFDFGGGGKSEAKEQAAPRQSEERAGDAVDDSDIPF